MCNKKNVLWTSLNFLISKFHIAKNRKAAKIVHEWGARYGSVHSACGKYLGGLTRYPYFSINIRRNERKIVTPIFQIPSLGYISRDERNKFLVYEINIQAQCWMAVKKTQCSKQTAMLHR